MRVRDLLITLIGRDLPPTLTEAELDRTVHVGGQVGRPARSVEVGDKSVTIHPEPSKPRTADDDWMPR